MEGVEVELILGTMAVFKTALDTAGPGMGFETALLLLFLDLSPVDVTRLLRFFATGGGLSLLADKLARNPGDIGFGEGDLSAFVFIMVPDELDGKGREVTVFCSERYKAWV